ncbi:putative solute-binding protein [Alcanivoracaceae bacterium MT1]
MFNLRVLCCVVFSLLPFMAGADDAREPAGGPSAVVFDQTRPLDERIQAMREVAGYTPGERVKRRICIWDIAGRAGPIFKAAEDQRSRVMKYGVDLEMVPYTSESVVVEDLKAGVCDAALMSGLRARLFNKYTGTIDAIGGLPSDAHMKLLLRAMASPKVAPKMATNGYVVLGIAPAGPAFVFVNDRAINTLANAAGKKVAVLDYDPVQAEMVAQIGATPVSSDIVTAPNKFNNGVVDVLAAPIVAYEVMELHKGMNPNGGIINYPLAQITMQLIGRADKFPNEVAQLVREEFLKGYDTVMARLEEEKAKVPDRWWIEIPEKDKREYELMMQDARLTLREKGYYSADMLTLERKVRCKLEPGRAECANPKE